MNQVPCVPMAPYVVQQAFIPAQPQPQPKLNAVNIEINNPSVGNTGSAAAQPQYVQNTLPVYSYPQAPIYSYPTTAQAPVCCPCPNIPVIQQPPVAVQPTAAPSVASTPVSQPVPPVSPVPVPGQINVNAPVPPVVTDTTASSAPEVPAPSVSEPPKTEQKPEVLQPEAINPQVDLNTFIAKLANPDFEVQAAGMEEIANMVKTSPEKATELVDTKIFDALTNIINYDSSALQGPTKEQVDAREKIMANKEVTEEEKQLANQITPKEQAERNKSYALFTTAIMQKLYGDEVSRLSNTTVPLTELPGAVTVVDNLKDNPNPMVRASAIEALSYIQNPAYKKDLTTVFTVASNDSDPAVAESAKTALDKLNQI